MWVGYDIVKDTAYRVNATVGAGNDPATGNPMTTQQHQLYAITLRHLAIGPQGAHWV